MFHKATLLKRHALPYEQRRKGLPTAVVETNDSSLQSSQARCQHQITPYSSHQRKQVLPALGPPPKNHQKITLLTTDRKFLPALD